MYRAAAAERTDSHCSSAAAATAVAATAAAVLPLLLQLSISMTEQRIHEPQEALLPSLVHTRSSVESQLTGINENENVNAHAASLQSWKEGRKEAWEKGAAAATASETSTHTATAVQQQLSSFSLSHSAAKALNAALDSAVA